MALSEDMEFEPIAVVDVDADIPRRDLEFLRNRAGSVMTLDEARAAKLRERLHVLELTSDELRIIGSYVYPLVVPPVRLDDVVLSIVHYR